MKTLGLLLGALALIGLTACGSTAAPAPAVPTPSPVVAPASMVPPPAPVTTPAPTTTLPAPTTTTPHAAGGPGCGERAVAAGTYDPSCSEYQGYLDPGGAAGRAKTSGESQQEYGCQQGYIPKSEC